MLNYLILTNIENKDELKKQFILGYEIVDTKEPISNIDYKKATNIPNYQQLIVYYADYSKHKFDYTKEKEKEILKKMKQQLIDYQDEIDFELARENNVSTMTQLGYTTIVFLFFGILGMVTIKSVVAMICFGLMTACSGFMMALIIFVAICDKMYKNDFQKNNLFLENEELINKMLNSEKSKNIFSNVNDKVKKASPVKPDGTCEMDINSINNMNLKDMKQLLEAIKRELMFEQSIEENKNKDKVLRK